MSQHCIAAVRPWRRSVGFGYPTCASGLCRFASNNANRGVPYHRISDEAVANGPKLQRSSSPSRRPATALAEVEESQTQHPLSTQHAPRAAPTARPPARGKFSFISSPSHRSTEKQWKHGEVPNNTPKPKLPPWASSLTSPALGKQRLVPDSWIASDHGQVLSDQSVEAFLMWMEAHTSTELVSQIRSTLHIGLRGSTRRGLYAKHDIRKGDLIFSIPVPATTAEVSGAIATTDSLRTSSSAGARRRVPSYTTIHEVLTSTRKSSFDHTAHPYFVEQVELALLLACERAEGEASPWHPLLQLWEDEVEVKEDGTPDTNAMERSGKLFDDDRIRELHLGVLDPPTHLEYTDLCHRFQHYARELHRRWWADFSDQPPTPPPQSKHVSADRDANASLCRPLALEDAPATTTAADSCVVAASSTSTTEIMDPNRPQPPSADDIEWALRVVLSRKRQLFGMGEDRSASGGMGAAEEVAASSLDHRAGNAIEEARWGFYQHVLGVVSADRLAVNEVDGTMRSSMVPMIDLLNHDQSGVGNVEVEVEREESYTQKEDGEPSSSAKGGRPLWIHVRASDDIEAYDELTTVLPRSYSVAYALYRDGFLALRPRTTDMTDLLRAYAETESRGSTRRS